MALYKIGETGLEKVSQTTFKAQHILERENLQKLIVANISAVAPDAMVLAEEYGGWHGSRRRIDLLCLDKEARLVVVELKRSEGGGHMDLQAVRYAAMVSTMSFSAAVQAHQDYLKALGQEGDSEAEILNFLEWDEPQDDFANEVAIVLVSADFSSELMTAVMWLSDNDIDIRCVALRLYMHAGEVLVDVEQKFPLPEAADYQVRIREKVREERQARQQNRDLTRYDLRIGDFTLPNLPKRWLAFHVIHAAVKRGAAPKEVLDSNKGWLVVRGEHNHESFIAAAAIGREPGSSKSETRRFFTGDDELIIHGGKTYALTKMWGLRAPVVAARVKDMFRLEDVEFTDTS